MISIRYFAPAPPLRPLISSYYRFESTLPRFQDLMRAELPQIRFITTGGGTSLFAGGQVRSSHGALLQGPTTGPVRFDCEGPLSLMGVGLLPRGWAELIGMPADMLADDMIDLADLVGRVAETALAQLVAASDDATRVAALDSLFTDLLARGHAAPQWFTRLTDDWLTGSPDPDVDALVTASGMSSRSVERLARRIYGASPKLLARKYRALGAAVRLGNREVESWRDLDAGFYDQAHFIREFKQFIGMTPSRFMVEAAPVTQLTIARKKLLPDLPKLALFS